MPLPPVKPGHWATASQKMRANYRDFVGDSRLSIVNSQNRPFAVAGTPFHVRSSRPVLLSKGRPKATETTFFVPQASQTINLSLELEERGLGSGPPQARTPLMPMPSYQYHFVVLAKTPSRYSYIKTIDSVKVPFNGESDADNTEDTLHYLVVELGADQIASLPDNPLTWTSVAYLLWDEIDPGEPFPAEQKKALVDWLHWGGQLIISGPDSLDLLKGSFLDAYLPATNGGSQKFAAGNKDLAELSSGWMISSPAAPGVPLSRPPRGRASNSRYDLARKTAHCPTPAACSPNARSAAAASSFPRFSFPSAISSIGDPASKVSSTPVCCAAHRENITPASSET